MTEISSYDEMQFFEVTNQIEGVSQCVKIIEGALKNTIDLPYLSSETALKIMLLKLINLETNLLHKKHILMREIAEKLEKKIETRNL